MCYGFDTWDLLVPRLVTLKLNFDLVLKNFNLGYIVWTKCVGFLYLRYRIDVLWWDLSFGNKTCDLDLVYLLNQMCWGFDTWGIDALWRDLSFGTKTFDLVTLMLNLDGATIKKKKQTIFTCVYIEGKKITFSRTSKPISIKLITNHILGWR
jgi:hypothetical protein